MTGCSARCHHTYPPEQAERHHHRQRQPRHQSASVRKPSLTRSHETAGGRGKPFTEGFVFISTGIVSAGGSTSRATSAAISSSSSPRHRAYCRTKLLVKTPPGRRSNCSLSIASRKRVESFNSWRSVADRGFASAFPAATSRRWRSYRGFPALYPQSYTGVARVLTRVRWGARRESGNSAMLRIEARRATEHSPWREPWENGARGKPRQGAKTPAEMRGARFTEPRTSESGCRRNPTHRNFGRAPN